MAIFLIIAFSNGVIVENMRRLVLSITLILCDVILLCSVSTTSALIYNPLDSPWYESKKENISTTGSLLDYYLPLVMISSRKSYLPLVMETSEQNRWVIRSVSSMNQTKDRVCNQRDDKWIAQWVAKIKEIGVTHIAIETPYDSPSCGDTLAYTQRWIQVIRRSGINVWHRHMPLAFEGIYGVPKDPSTDYLQMICDYIIAHPEYFKEGDIFTPIPEPQNGGIVGVTYCSQDVCIFQNTSGSGDAREEFNAWIRSAMTKTERTFEVIGLKDKIKIGYFGFDGFVAWGDNNPDWEGIIEPATIRSMGNMISIDHCPEAVGDTMENDLKELHERFPGIPVVISEWGTITGGDVEKQVLNSLDAAKKDPLVIGVQYWQGGPAGPEALLNDNFSSRPQFDEVQSFYRECLTCSHQSASIVEPASTQLSNSPQSSATCDVRIMNCLLPRPIDDSLADLRYYRGL